MESGNGVYDMEIVNRTINLCEFFINPRYEPIIQVFYKAVSRNAVVPSSCPVQKVPNSSENSHKFIHFNLLEIILFQRRYG